MKKPLCFTWIRLKNYGLIILGTLLLAFGTAVFILPFELIVGGISSYAILLSRWIPVAWLTVDLLVAILSWGLFLIGFLVLGRDFAAKTLLSALIYPTGVSLFLRLSSPHILDGFFCMTEHPNGEVSLILSAAVGGVMIGVGCALAFLGGGSTGGTDVLAFIICKYIKGARSSVVIFCVDALAVTLGIFAAGDLTRTLLGIFSIMISAWMIDRVFLGGNRAYVAQIVSDRQEEVSSGLIRALSRTTTNWETVGGYTGKPHAMVMVSFTLREYADVMRVIRKEDPHAFVSIYRAHQINGEGWE